MIKKTKSYELLKIYLNNYNFIIHKKMKEQRLHSNFKSSQETPRENLNNSSLSPANHSNSFISGNVGYDKGYTERNLDTSSYDGG